MCRRLDRRKIHATQLYSTKGVCYGRTTARMTAEDFVFFDSIMETNGQKAERLKREERIRAERARVYEEEFLEGFQKAEKLMKLFRKFSPPIAIDD